jgi:hypothetical protein
MSRADRSSSCETLVGAQFAYAMSVDRRSNEPSDVDGPVSEYANGLQIGHNAFEFVFEFVQQYGSASTRTRTRIVTSPAYAKLFLRTLTSSIAHYEAEFGMIASAYTDSERDD